MTLSCREFADFLLAWLDGEVPPEQAAEFEEHLVRCPPCVDYVETYRETIRQGKLACQHQNPGGEPPEDAPEALVSAILAVRKPR